MFPFPRCAKTPAWVDFPDPVSGHPPGTTAPPVFAMTFGLSDFMRCRARVANAVANTAANVAQRTLDQYNAQVESAVAAFASPTPQPTTAAPTSAPYSYHGP